MHARRRPARLTVNRSAYAELAEARGWATVRAASKELMLAETTVGRILAGAEPSGATMYDLLINLGDSHPNLSLAAALALFDRHYHTETTP